MYWLLQGITNPTGPFLFVFIIGNCTTLTLILAAPLFANKKFPWDWLVYLAIILPVSAVASSIASVASPACRGRDEHLFRLDWNDIRSGTFLSLISGISVYISRRGRARLERRNRELETQVTVGQIKLQAHEAELKTAHEIQAHLLPHDLPQMKPFQIACAWEAGAIRRRRLFRRARRGSDRLGICMADVSGKGITAALLMANLQAAVRAFAPGIAGPGLCATS